MQAILSNLDEVARYAALHKTIRHHGIPENLIWCCEFGKLLGWPTLVQWEDLDVLRDESESESFRLLLRLDQYSNGEELEGWGPGGSLYFIIDDRDLRERRFDRCHFEMQMHLTRCRNAISDQEARAPAARCW